jgi:hypothetical protein
LRKILSDYINRELVSTDWIANLLYASEAVRKAIDAKKLDGFVQKFQVNYCCKLCYALLYNNIN